MRDVLRAKMGWRHHENGTQARSEIEAAAIAAFNVPYARPPDLGPIKLRID